MQNFARFCLKVARAIYLRKRHIGDIPSSNIAWDPQYASKMISQLLLRDAPCMIARFGATELKVLAPYYLRKQRKAGYLGYIRGKTPTCHDFNDFWAHKLSEYSGFFPASTAKSPLIEQFCELMLNDIPELDLLASWLSYEQIFDHMHHSPKIHILNLEPFDKMDEPWSQHLEHKKVLVVHPFAKSIENQYKNKRELLFKNPKVLPEFDLKIITAVQSLGGAAPPEFSTWFDALECMKKQIDEQDYDICLLGCGAYGFPLAAHIKRSGKKAIHVGGSLQLLFGIKGKRWVEQYGANSCYSEIFNEHWIFPEESERPKTADAVENACYW